MKFLRELLARLIEALDRLLQGQSVPEGPAPEDSGDSTPPEQSESPAAETGAAPPPTGDAIPIDSIWWAGKPAPAMAEVTAKVHAATIERGMIYTTFDPYRWPSNNKQPKPLDASIYIIYRDAGRIVGGRFDDWRNGGQAAKTLENITEGKSYHGLALPVKGSDVWMMISSLDGKQRSNIVKVAWR